MSYTVDNDHWTNPFGLFPFVAGLFDHWPEFDSALSLRVGEIFCQPEILFLQHIRVEGSSPYFMSEGAHGELHDDGA